MNILLDSHAFIWWLAGSVRMSDAARNAVADQSNEVFISAASAWEITTKYRLGRIPGAAAVALDPARALIDQGFAELSISFDAAARAGLLPGPIRDPFDRILIAQAHVHDLVLVSNETQFDAYGIRRHW